MSTLYGRRLSASIASPHPHLFQPPLLAAPWGFPAQPCGLGQGACHPDSFTGRPPGCSGSPGGGGTVFLLKVFGSITLTHALFPREETLRAGRGHLWGTIILPAVLFWGDTWD